MVGVKSNVTRKTTDRATVTFFAIDAKLTWADRIFEKIAAKNKKMLRPIMLWRGDNLKP